MRVYEQLIFFKGGLVTPQRTEFRCDYSSPVVEKKSAQACVNGLDDTRCQITKSRFIVFSSRRRRDIILTCAHRRRYIIHIQYSHKTIFAFMSAKLDVRTMRRGGFDHFRYTGNFHNLFSALSRRQAETPALVITSSIDPFLHKHYCPLSFSHTKFISSILLFRYRSLHFSKKRFVQTEKCLEYRSQRKLVVHYSCG